MYVNCPSPRFVVLRCSDLSIFKPTQSFFMADVRQQRGIHCRFGMPGIIAETHFDSGECTWRGAACALHGRCIYLHLPGHWQRI